MPFDLTQFLSSYAKYGSTSANKFDVTITPPTIISNNNPQITTQMPTLLAFRADEVNSPAIGFTSTESNRYGMGPVTKQPYNAIFGEVRMSFITDKTGIIYEFFYLWMNYIYNFTETYTANGIISGNSTSYTVPTYTTNYEDDIVAPGITINTYNNLGSIIKNVNLYRAKPTLFIESPFSWEKVNTLVRLTISFSFREWAASFPAANTTSASTNTGS
jgi:hypothetical protein